jgi:hypothetical protein
MWQLTQNAHVMPCRAVFLAGRGTDLISFSRNHSVILSSATNLVNLNVAKLDNTKISQGIFIKR